MIFWRVFMRISYRCPDHLKFAIDVQLFTKLWELTGEAIDWLDNHDEFYDVWMLTAYAATSCAFVQVGSSPLVSKSLWETDRNAAQYHTVVRRKDEIARAKLKKLRDTVRRWEAPISPEHMSVRRKASFP